MGDGERDEADPIGSLSLIGIRFADLQTLCGELIGGRVDIRRWCDGIDAFRYLRWKRLEDLARNRIGLRKARLAEASPVQIAQNHRDVGRVAVDIYQLRFGSKRLVNL